MLICSLLSIFKPNKELTMTEFDELIAFLAEEVEPVQ
jgi:hypothetical protein